MKKTLGILSALAISGSAFADVNVSGYVDAGASWTKAATKTSSFRFNEGGVWFTGNAGGSSFVADLDVGTGAFEQAFITHKYDNGFSWSVGYWDAQLGAESSDSVNRHFLKTGLLYGLVSSTETGLLMNYDLSDTLGLGFWVVNGNKDAATGLTNTGDVRYPGLGFKLTSKMDGMNARVGGHFESADGETGYIMDIGADTKMGDIHVAASLLLVKAAVKDGESGLGFGVEGGTTISEGTTFDLGVEWENGKATGVDTKQTTLELRAGPRFAMSDALTVKADYTLKSFGGDAAANKDAEHMVGLAGIYKF